MTTSTSPVILTRACLDDLGIFRVWIEYYRRRYSDIRCSLFRRPGDDITPLIDLCTANNIVHSVLEAPVFDNGPTYDAMRELAADSEGKVCLVVDCDEFVSDFDALDAIVSDMPADSVLLKMVDRLSYDIFYDISDCATYEDLCAVAPLKGNITATIQKWSDDKCCLNRLPDLGVMHYPSRGKSSKTLHSVHLDHFKWREEWIPKARRRLSEVTSIGYSWQNGLRSALEILGDPARPRKYLTIPGFCDYENIYEEQCRKLPEGARLIELGVWQGRSLCHLAEMASLLGKRFEIYGIDIFGGPLHGQDVWKDYSLHGTKANLEWRGLGGTVRFLQSSIAESALYFADQSVDFAWLDASHGVESVMKHLVAWWPKMKTGATLGGHDLTFYGVSEALERLRIPYTQNGSSWVCSIPENRPTLVLPMP